MNHLHVDSITKNYDLKVVLSDVYFSANTGDIIGLFGRNGSGKSTLMKIIFGSLKANSRFVRVDDKIIQNVNDRKGLINYLPQNHFLPRHINVKTIISIFCDKEKAAILLKKEAIKKVLYLKQDELSGGERRLLEIYLIVLSKAKFILLDEPFNGVAPIYREDIKKLIREQSKYKGIIITDHDYRNILDICTKMVLIHDGATKEIKEKEELITYGYLSGLSS